MSHAVIELYDGRYGVWRHLIETTWLLYQYHVTEAEKTVVSLNIQYFKDIQLMFNNKKRVTLHFY